MLATPRPICPLWCAVGLAVTIAACGGNDGRPRPTRDGAIPDGAGGPCAEGEIRCSGRTVETCHTGIFERGAACPADTVCVGGYGCRTCSPGSRYCAGNEIRLCAADGESFSVEGTCEGALACRAGMCVDACTAARDERSNVGCEYWAVDLDNEYAETILGTNDAAGEQFAVVLANPSDVNVDVTVQQNEAAPGMPPAPSLVFSGVVGARALLRIDLPQREVDGSVSRDDGPGTMLSSRAYYVQTNYPVVAYQFNPIVQSFSNDASLLIPASGLDTHHRVLGWPTANPITIPGFPAMPGLPDHSFVTIVGNEPGTTVTVTLGGPIVGGGGIPATPAGGVVTATLGPYDVLNLESDMIPGDLTGTVVVSSAPVAVFSGGERGIAPYETDGVPVNPGGGPGDMLCCTDHLEEQVFPTTAWGKQFVVTRSPVRSAVATWNEPDIYRVLADKNGTVVTTNLPAPNDRFTLESNQWREFYPQESFILEATEAVSIEQIQVSQAWVGDWKPGHGGDPSMSLMAPYEQYRDDYIFLVPDTFTANYVVIAMPLGTAVELDAVDINADEFMRTCVYEEVGAIDGTTYLAVTCPVTAGTHRVHGTLPVGIMVYGYYSVGSYAYVGGSNLTRINLI